MTDRSRDVTLESALEELQAINSLIEAVCRVRETNHVMSTMIDGLVRITDADQGVISLVEEQHESEAVTVVRKHQSEAGEFPYRVSELVAGWILQKRRVLKIDDIESDERFKGLTSDGGAFKSMLCCPMIARGEAIGIVSLVRSGDKPPFDEQHARVAGIVSSQSAQILSNAILLEELAHKAELLELSASSLRRENTLLKAEIGTAFHFENIIGNSKPMREVMTVISKVCGTNSPVLITGPTGTGKELIAKAIHYNSRRKDKPFAIKNCGVKTESLLESELFGHVKGAFTGAVSNRKGLFQEADGGSIFLDEIGDAPLATQVAILRAIETGEVRPIGSSQTEHVDVRVISATNKDLESEIEGGRFRQDLYYRVNTFTIEVAALNRRPSDIPLLVNHFLRKIEIKAGTARKTISPNALDALIKYSWPGNVRQLENEIERAVILADSRSVIEISDLSPAILLQESVPSLVTEFRGNLKEAVENVEREMIARVLDDNEGNIQRSSRELGLTRKGLKDKMSRYGIKADSGQSAGGSE